VERVRDGFGCEHAVPAIAEQIVTMSSVYSIAAPYLTGCRGHDQRQSVPAQFRLVDSVFRLALGRVATGRRGTRWCAGRRVNKDEQSMSGNRCVAVNRR